MIGQLKGLAEEKHTYHDYIFYLLESLATVKSIVLLLDVDDGRGERDRLLLQLFNLTFDLTAVPHLSRPARLYLFEILQTLIDEAEVLPTEIIRSIIGRCGDVRETVKAFAGELVHSCADKLQPAFGMYFNETVLGWLSHSSSGKASEHARLEPLKHIHSQMVNVGRVAPLALTVVLPQLEAELQTAENEVRLVAINSLAALFATPKDEIIKLYPVAWSAWLQKMNDKTPQIRLQWIRNALDLLTTVNDVQYQKDIQSALVDKLQEQDAKMREKTIQLLNKFLEDGNPPRLLLGQNLSEEIAMRCRDKVDDVRMAAMKLLCELIRCLFDADPHNRAIGRLADSLFLLLYTNDRDLRIFYEYFIEHSLMMPRSALDKHALFMTTMFNGLADEARRAFKKWLADKSLFVKYFDVFMKIATVRPDDSRLATINQHLANLFRVPLDAQAMLKAIPFVLHQSKPNNDLIDKLNAIVDPRTSIAQQEQIIEQLFAVDWTKKDARIKDYLVTFMIRRASLLSINGELLTALLELSPSEAHQQTFPKLVSELIGEFPSLGLKHASVMENAILDYPENLENLVAYSRFASACHGKLKPSSSKLVEILNEMRFHGERKQVKYAVRTLISLYDPESLPGEYYDSLKELSDKTSLLSVREWQTLVEIARRPGLNLELKLIEKAQSTFKALLASEETHLVSKNGISIDHYSSGEMCAVLATRSLQHWLFTLKSIPSEHEYYLGQLREVAPILVQWLEGADSPRVKYSLAKALILLVPRPNVFTLATNLGPLCSFLYDCPVPIRDRLHQVIMRQYQIGTIGMVFLGLSAISLIDGRLSNVKQALAAIKNSDRFADTNLPLDEEIIEINSRNLHRYEDWLIINIMILSLHPALAEFTESSLLRSTNLIEMFVDLVSTEVNVSFLFNAAVQLKRHKFISTCEGKTRTLYILSEILQNALREKATTSRWLLQSIKTTINISDEMLQEIDSMDEIGKNMKKMYLTRLKDKLQSQRTRQVDGKTHDRDSKMFENVQPVENNAELASSSSTPQKRLRRSERNKPVIRSAKCN